MRLPLLDISKWRANPVAFATELRTAAHTIGFFQVRHGVPQVATDALDACHAFFALPLHQKREIDYRASPAFRGFMEEGMENTQGAPDMREQIEIGAEAPPAHPRALPPYERLRGPNQWPPHLPTLRSALDAYATHMLGLSRELTAALCMALHLPEGALAKLFVGGVPPQWQPHWQMKAVHYSPAEDDIESASLGVGAHSDSGFLTLVVQDADGLQVHTGGEWIDVPSEGPDVVVCNLGEVAEMVSGGFLLATPHRVLRRKRLSLPFFYNPHLSAHVQPVALSADVQWQRPEKHTASHWRARANRHLTQYGMNAFKSLARSHPEVMRRHHPDLEVHADGQVTARNEQCL
uniref:Fe2OG dioxygenase domain-containing protein n=1 Tax=Calcidiscus leptoporus TaxID=127549 RepID=A0A7S0JHI0_9EUKA|mmetsp:Transcript_59167/g.135703  ORF Transcript_59167/g.135703 Transcript_59167/m.135703 type:complete len:349 (+) Transcript_59167:173-1219(+)